MTPRTNDFANDAARLDSSAPPTNGKCAQHRDGEHHQGSDGHRPSNNGRGSSGESRAEQSAPSAYELTNTNKWSTRQLASMALLCAIGVLLSFIEFPLLPGVAWLKYDASAMPAMVCGFAFGPGAGLAVGVVGAVIHGILFADFSGALMNILVVSGFVLPAALLYRRSHTLKGAIAGLAISVAAATLMAVVGNLLITPTWLGVPLDAVITMIAPVLIPFNVVKGALNATLTLIVYKSVSNLVTPKKKQVKGLRGR